ncbi:MAG: flagellar protein FlgN [Thermodesulfobacteriota bacterium]
MEIAHITDHLSQEASAYKEFISVLQRETECLVGRDYKGLYETVAGKEALIARVRKLGERRQALLADCARSLGMEGADEDVVSAIVERATGPQKEEFLKLQNIIGSLIDTIHEVNRVNSLVIKGSLEHLNKTLGFFGNFMPGSVYKPNGAFGEIPLKGSRLSEGV